MWADTWSVWADTGGHTSHVGGHMSHVGGHMSHVGGHMSHVGGHIPCGTDWFGKRFVSVRTVGIANQKQTFLERLYVARSERFSKRFSNVHCNGAIESTPHSK